MSLSVEVPLSAAKLLCSQKYLESNRTQERLAKGRAQSTMVTGKATSPKPVQSYGGMSMRNAQADILNRGFVVVSDFLSPTQIDRLQSDYRRNEKNESELHTLGVANVNIVEHLLPNIEELIEEISSETLSVNTVGKGPVFFAIENGINFGWHQDHESYYLTQNHWNYINLYIPIIKPIREKTNLSIVPADNFERCAPDLWAKLRGRGATSAVEREGKTYIRDDHAGGFLGALSCNFRDISETPRLNEGDALFMRGDLFHRTQDTETLRVALSIRIWNNNDTVTRSHFLTTCAEKERIMQHNTDLYKKLDKAFAKKGQMTLRELMFS